MKKLDSYESYNSYDFVWKIMNLHEYECESPWISMNMNLAFHETYMSRKLSSMNMQWMRQNDVSCMSMNNRQKLKIVIQLISTVWIDFQNRTLRQYVVNEGEEKESEVFATKKVRIMLRDFLWNKYFYNFVSRISHRGSTCFRPHKKKSSNIAGNHGKSGVDRLGNCGSSRLSIGCLKI